MTSMMAKRDARRDQAVFDRGGAGFIGGKFGQH